MIEFKKFEAITKAGVSYRKYIEALATIQYATEAYAEEADELNAENKLKFKDALKKYKLAGDGWEVYLASKKHGVPEMFKDYSKGYCPATNFYSIGGQDNFHECISEMWINASVLLVGAKEVKPETRQKRKNNP